MAANRDNTEEVMDVEYIRKDRMRYEKNKASANLALLAIVLDALFFVSIYKSNVGTYYYTPLIGVSIIYNLVFMMLVFLISEGSKSYDIRYSYLAIPLGILQFVRILIYPVRAHGAQIDYRGETIRVMQNAQFTRTLVYLIGSGVCLLACALIGIKKCGDLKSHLAQLEQNNK